MTIFDGCRATWFHQYTETQEKSIEALAATSLNLAGSSILIAKAMDSGDWMATFDDSAEAISSLAKWQETVARGAAVGVTVIPFVNPFGPQDASAHAQLGGPLVVDLEAYTGFWSAPVGQIPSYLFALRNAGVDPLFVSIDPRQVSTLNASAWASMVDGLLPQCYFTDFQQPYTAVIPMLQAVVDLGVPVIPALPYNAVAADIKNFWAAAQQMGCVAPSLWVLGSANAAQLQAFSTLAIPGGAPPVVQPPQPEPDWRDSLDRAKTGLATSERQLADATAQVANYQGIIANLTVSDAAVGAKP